MQWKFAATLRVASKQKIPTLIQEQNSYPGITNKWLAKKALKICVAYDGLDRFFPKDKIVKTGNLSKFSQNKNLKEFLMKTKNMMSFISLLDQVIMSVFVIRVECNTKVLFGIQTVNNRWWSQVDILMSGAMLFTVWILN